MSYILEALKKSEEERAGRMPNLKSVHQHPTGQTGSLFKWWSGAILILVLLLAATAYLYYKPPSSSAESTLRSSEHSEPALAHVTALATAEEGLAKKPMLPSKKPDTTSIPTMALSNKMDARSTGQAASARTPTPYAELTPARQADLPVLNFSTHIYSHDAELRMVSINGSNWSEGDRISEQLILEEITETGVILDFRDQLISISVIEDWQ